MNTEKLRALAPDLNHSAPRSPYVRLGQEFPAVAARLVDKCRAELLGQSGSYHYNCPMDRRFFAAAGLEAEPLREFIATGADDNQVAAWMSANARAPREKIISWARRFRANPLWRLLEFEDWVHERRHRRTRG
jgi:Domain of unknown function (DUF5069)